MVYTLCRFLFLQQMKLYRFQLKNNVSPFTNHCKNTGFPFCADGTKLDTFRVEAIPVDLRIQLLLLKNDCIFHFY